MQVSNMLGAAHWK